MMIETARLIQAALLDPTTGVNAKLTAINASGLDGSDAALALFDVDNIVEESSDPRAALRRPDAADEPRATLFPAVLIHCPELEWLERTWGQLGDRIDGNVTVHIRLALLQDDPAVALRETYYRLPAIERAVRHLMIDPSDAKRTRNGVRLITLDQLTRLVVTIDPGDRLTMGGIRAVFYGSDLAPL